MDEIKMAADLNSFVEKTLKLLDSERQAEIDESRAFFEGADNTKLENKGVCLRKMAIFSRKTGLYGRTLLTLGKAKGRSARSLPLSAHRITTGDVVGLSYSSSNDSVTELSSGIVTKVTETLIVLAFDETVDSLSVEENRLLRITRLANDVTFKRMKKALETLSDTSSCCSSHLVSVLFGNSPIGPPLNIISLHGNNDTDPPSQQIFFDEKLNESQRAAVGFALTSREVAVVHGPPGTGKTTTIVEAIVQAVKNCSLKVLACAPSNIAVDNILERLVKYKIKAVRLGHPARVMENIHGYSLDAILDSSDDAAIVKDVRKDIDTALRKRQSSRNAGERSRLRTEIKTLRKELREREEKALKQILQNAQVILSTCVSASDDGPMKHLPKDHFDLVVIDEAGQALEAACWISLSWAPRCILAGDHKQLPPTILSRDAAKQGLETTLMERVINLLGDKVVHMLTTQYRMNEAIMTWPSRELYDGRLLADMSVAQHLLRHLPEVKDTELTSIPLLMIDTAGCDLYELQALDEESKGNEGEADVVAAHIEGLVASGVKQHNIGVITPYNLQVELLRSRLSIQYPALEIKSVDGFQGREKEAILISMVRSNAKGEIGFLAENRRMNVAVTRARRHLTIIGDSSTLSHDPFLGSLVEYIGAHGEVWSAEQYRCHISGDITRIASSGGTNASNRGKSTAKTSKTNNDISKVSKTNNRQKTEKNAFQKGPKISNSKLGFPNTLLDNVAQSGTTADNTQELEGKIKAFLSDPARSNLVFPTGLTSRDRFTVHRLAEEFGLEHVSKGTGEERFIAVAKKPSLSPDEKNRNERITKQPERNAEESEYTMQETACSTEISEDHTEDPECDTEDSECSTEETEHERGVKTNVCQFCGKQVPTSNMCLHEVMCSLDRRGAATSSKQKLKKGLKKSEKSDNTDNFDELLAEFTQKDSRCALDGCRKSALTVGQNCRFCANMYCLGHRFPEVHGCTQAAKDHARHSTGTPKQMSNKVVAKRGDLERKLGNKIKNMEGKRRTKSKHGK